MQDAIDRKASDKTDCRLAKKDTAENGRVNMLSHEQRQHLV